MQSLGCGWVWHIDTSKVLPSTLDQEKKTVLKAFLQKYVHSLLD